MLPKCKMCGKQIAGTVADPVIHLSKGIFHVACKEAFYRRLQLEEELKEEKRRFRKRAPKKRKTKYVVIFRRE